MVIDYHAAKWTRFREKILKRDGYMCQSCKRYGRATEATEVHHIRHADEYPELVFDADNVISLCHACHNKQHPEKAKAAKRNRY